MFYSGDAKKVKLGYTDPDTHPDDVKIINIIDRIHHPEYKKPYKYHDIALLKLESSVEFSPYVRPACLNTHPVHYKEAIAIGFGKTKYGK